MVNDETIAAIAAEERREEMMNGIVFIGITLPCCLILSIGAWITLYAVIRCGIELFK